ncbi:MAG: YdcF family protein [Bacteroidia bacterium]|nr:YdcF family protein [Bacteroidia bacterium]
MKKIKIIWLIALIICFLFVVSATLVNVAVTKTGNRFCYSSVDSIPHNHCALVLGTSKYLWNGKRNLYYTNRIKAAVELYNHNKIDFIIVSGDNRNRNYNEPITMYNDLVQAGIPNRKIILDYAGFRTLDSVVRGKEVFGQDKFTIVSQSFHNQRAVYIARKKGIEAIAFNTEDVTGILTLKVQMREIAARMLVIFDMAISRQPHFLGEKVVVPVE